MCKYHGLDYVFMGDSHYTCVVCGAISERTIFDKVYAEGVDTKGNQETWVIFCTSTAGPYADGSVCETSAGTSVQVQASNCASSEISTDPSEITQEPLVIHSTTE